MMKEQGDGPSSNSGGNGNAGKFSLFTAGLHNKILLETEQQHNQNLSPSKQISARSKLSTHPPNNPATHQSGQSKQKPKRPSSANPRVRSSHQHRDPGKPHKNHPILNNPNHNQQPPPKNKEEFYEGRNFAVLNRLNFLHICFDWCP